MKVLVAEDDSYTRKGLLDILRGEGYDPIAASDGDEACRLFESERPDVVCLDVMMPKASGYDVCQHIRRLDPSVPILFISAKSEEIDTVLGLELGADDFIIKPFGVKALIARIRAVTRRCLARRPPAQQERSFIMDDLRIVPEELRAYRGEDATELSLRDIKILTLLSQNRGKVVDREILFRKCWGVDHLSNSRALDQHISQLRKRIERSPSKPVIIKTVHGVGYRFDG